MRIASWNVNSMRARAEQLLDWLVDREIDVALLQETKCTDGDFPFDALHKIGYAAAHHGKNHWNGVAILSRCGLTDVTRGFVTGGAPSLSSEPRLIAAKCGDVRCWSVYVPNGRAVDDPHFDYKLRWLDQLARELEALTMPQAISLVAGDFNVGLADLDFYDAKRWVNKKHATPQERECVGRILDLGLRDLVRHRHPEEPMFTWWNYVGTQFAKNKGLRIDLALGSERFADMVEGAWVDREARDPQLLAPAKPSDHAPVIIDVTSG